MFITDCKKFKAFSDRKNTNVKRALIKEEIENLQKKYLVKRCKTMKKLTGITN